MTSSYIDLRSDTVTKPDAEMRKAMADAEVGDDVLDHDPTMEQSTHYQLDWIGQRFAGEPLTSTCG